MDRYPSFEAKFQALQAMQAAANSERKLQSAAERHIPPDASDTTSAHLSTYQRQQRAIAKPADGGQRSGPKMASCRWCGERHRISNPHFQDPSCPARGKMCSRCKKANHFTQACRSRRQSQICSESADDIFGDASAETSAQVHISSRSGNSTITAAASSCAVAHNVSTNGAVPHMEWSGSRQNGRNRTPPYQSR